jgi:hypothetical protein
MNKETIKAFIAWLETASNSEISERRTLILNQSVKTQEGKADIKLALRLLDEEMLARLELGRLSKPS